ncbi:MAG: pirin family protein [Xanthomonadales bacterium]|nr:pirin family protein [Xanthomonadales bacterium]NIX11902.1 pirin family protein [Xanthomonadales bacterium]
MHPLVLKPAERDIGDFSVRRVLPSAARRAVGPFVFWDHFGPVTLPAGKGMDVRPHPHIGLATVTYLFEGEILHRDSLGCVQAIRPGAVNWMTAGRGIVHSERTDQKLRSKPNRMHGLQVWLALPDGQEDVEPAFHHHPEGSLPEIRHDDAVFRLIAGATLGSESPVQVFSPLFYMETSLRAGQSFRLPDEYPERAVYLAAGRVSAAGTIVEPHCMAVFEAGGTPVIQAQTDVRIAVLGGDPVGRRHLWWNFVASSRERIRFAAERWEAGGFDRVPGDDEFIPLPDRRPW